MDTLIDVIQRNDNAVDLITRGDLDNAGILLRECFAMAKECLVNDSTNRFLNQDDNQSSCQQQHQGYPSEGFLNPSQSPLAPIQSYHHNFFMYNRPLYFGSLLRYLCQSGDIPFNQGVSIVSAIIILNMAFVYHLLAVVRNDSKALMKAAKLYFSAIRLSIESSLNQHLDYASSQDSQFHRLIMGIFIEVGLIASNNACQLSRDISAFGQAADAADYMETFAAHVLPQNLLILDENDWNEILTNALSLSMQNSSHGTNNAVKNKVCVQPFAPAA